MHHFSAKLRVDPAELAANESFRKLLSILEIRFSLFTTSFCFCYEAEKDSFSEG